MRLTLQRNGNILIDVKGNIDPIQLNIDIQLKKTVIFKIVYDINELVEILILL